MQITPSPEIRREMLILGDEMIDAYLGSRTWRCTMANGFARLTSVYQDDVVWLPGATVESECRCKSWSRRDGFEGVANAYEPADYHKSCGLHAWRAGILPTDPGAGLQGWLDSLRFIHGEVHLWGDVHIHERGYRAQFARPSAFYVWDTMHDETRMKTEIAALQFMVPLIQMDSHCDHTISRHNWVTGVRTCACGSASIDTQTRRARR